MERRSALRDRLALVVLIVAALLPATASARAATQHKLGPGSQPSTNMLWGFSGMGHQFSQLNPPAQPPWDMNSVTAFESTVSGGKGVSVIGWGSPFYSDTWCGGYCGFTTPLYDTVRQSGAIPILSWGSTQHDGAGGQPGYSDADIAAGSQDSYITQWARAAAQWGHPFFVRFDWEMNGDWFLWNGDGANSAADFVAMWRHVHDIFVANGATNATWVWCPNIDPDNVYQSLRSLYPGADYVDWTCIDAYNHGTPWTDFANLASRTYSAIRRFAPNKPMLIGETGSVENPTDSSAKADWIHALFSSLQNNFPSIRGVLWYESTGENGEAWPIESSPQSINAFDTEIANPAYQGSAYQNLDTPKVLAP